MATRLESSLAALDTSRARRALNQLNRGVEKESLRVLPSGDLSQTRHPAALGAALTHPHITTDFCEAQPELVTGIHQSVQSCIDELTDIHCFVYRHLDEELLWSSSMPCMLGSDAQVPIAQFGESNIGRAKHIYRLGLASRYGRLMQTISGIHYNFSIPDSLWPILAEAQGAHDSREFRDAAYFGLIRNFRRHSWLLIYLFGASPTLCKSFVKNKQHGLANFDEGSLYLPHATSLRMGRLGYQSDAQTNLHISYNSLPQYARSMLDALTRPYPPYQRIGIKVRGEYRQLTTTLLQIENEFYGTIRPKRVIKKGQRHLAALSSGGVEYVEVRCLDLNPFLPLGIDAEEIRFLDAFLLHCLLSDSPPDSEAETRELSINQLRTVESGRRPGLTLAWDGQEVELAVWAEQLLGQCRPIAELLDRTHGSSDYAESWDEQRARLADPDRTPSARILAAMQRARIPFFRFAMNQSILHKGFFDAHQLPVDAMTRFERLATQSHADQRAMETADNEPLDDFLRHYLAPPSIDAA
jgi:glutamate--cysteine ligase